MKHLLSVSAITLSSCFTPDIRKKNLDVLEEVKEHPVVESTPETITLTSGLSGRMCKQSTATKKVLMIPWKSPRMSCNQDPVVQFFLRMGFNVVISGPIEENNWGGPSAQSKVQEIIRDHKDVVGIWASEWSATAVLGALKKIQVQWAVLNSPILDVETFLQSSLAEQTAVPKLAAEDVNFTESRSIAWDPTGINTPLLVFFGDQHPNVIGGKMFADQMNSQNAPAQVEILREVGPTFTPAIEASALEALKSRFPPFMPATNDP